MLLHRLTFLVPLATLAIFALTFFLPISSSSRHATDKSTCEMTYMSPSYLHIAAFNKHSKFGMGPWGLYLYREAGWDYVPEITEETVKITGLKGRPVVFIPGNAGSFRQARSFASVASRMYSTSPGRPNPEFSHQKPLDVFTIDFNDDFSAFHGQTLRDQAEYVVDVVHYLEDLYGEKVILIGHSMGGVVGLYALDHSKYRGNLVETFITFSSPLALAPAPLDSTIEHVYDVVHSAKPPTNGLFLLSITGGHLDTLVAAETANPSYLSRPGIHTLFVSTSAIPNLHSACDHLAILWCNQVVRTVVNGLLAFKADSRENTAKKLKRNFMDMFQMNAVRSLDFGSGEAVQSSSETGQEVDIDSGKDIFVSLDYSTGSRIFRIVGEEQGEITILSSSPDVNISNSLSKISLQKISITPSLGYWISRLVLPKDASLVIESRQQTGGWLMVKNGDEDKKIYLNGWFTGLRLLLGGTISTRVKNPRLFKAHIPDTIPSIVFKTRLSHNCKIKTANYVVSHSSSEDASDIIQELNEDWTILYGQEGGSFLPLFSERVLTYTNPSLNESCEPILQLKIDWKRTVRLVVIPYRMIPIWIPFLVALGILYIQLDYQTDFYSSMLLLFGLPNLKVGFTSFLGIQVLFFLCSQMGIGWTRNLMAGNSGSLGALIIHTGLLGALIVGAIGIAFIELAVLSMLVKLVQIITRKSPTSFSHVDSSLFGRLLPVCSLIFVTHFYIPHQFAFLDLFLIQLWNVASLEQSNSSPAPAGDSDSASSPTPQTESLKIQKSRARLHFTFLYLMMTLLPLVGLVLIVWIRNLGVGWAVPFRNDHSFLRVIGFLLLVERGAHPTTSPTYPKSRIVRWSVGAVSVAALLFGLRYTFILYVLGNILAVVFMTDEWAAEWREKEKVAL